MCLVHPSHAIYWRTGNKNARYRTIERYRAQKGSLAKGSWHGAAVTEGFTAGTSPKVQTYVETCKPAESPRFGYAKPPPFDKGGFGLCTYCTAVTIPGGSGK